MGLAEQAFVKSADILPFSLFFWLLTGSMSEGCFESLGLGFFDSTFEVLAFDMLEQLDKQLVGLDVLFFWASFAADERRLFHNSSSSSTILVEPDKML